MDWTAAALVLHHRSIATMGPGFRRGDGGRVMHDNFLPCVYILASARHGTLYTGVTSNLVARLHQHREGLIPGFTQRHNVKRLVHYETFGDMEHAIVREKRIKDWRRAWKIVLIEERNPEWNDLALVLGFPPLKE